MGASRALNLRGWGETLARLSFTSLLASQLLHVGPDNITRPMSTKAPSERWSPTLAKESPQDVPAAAVARAVPPVSHPPSPSMQKSPWLTVGQGHPPALPAGRGEQEEGGLQALSREAPGHSG
jgi:hypothetical protein